MDAVVSLLWFFVILPGAGHYLVSRRLDPETSWPERWAVALGVGFWSVAFCATLAWFLPLHRLGWWEPAMIVRVASLAVFGAARWTWARLPPAPTAPRFPSDRVVAAITVVVFALFFIGVDDNHFTKGCLYASLDALSDPDPGAPLPIHRVSGDERFGNVVAAWVVAGFCPTLVERVGHGFFAALLFLSSVSLGRRLTGRNWPGLVAGTALVLTDDVFGYEIFNQNLIAGSTAVLFILVLFQDPGKSGGILASFLAAMLVSSRYVAFAGIGALAFAAASGETTRAARVRRVLESGLWFFAFLAPTLAGVGLGSASILTILDQRLLNFPGLAEIVRTPLLPFPMWVGWPLDFFVQWDILGMGLLVLGYVLLARAPSPRRVLVTLVAYAAPLVVVLLVQENWLEPEKMSLKLVLAPAVVGPIAFALARIGAGGRRAIALFAITSIGLGLASYALRPILTSLRFPEDARVREAYPGLPGEERRLLEFERSRWLEWRLVPFPRCPGVLRVFDEKVEQVVRVLFRGEDPHAEPSVSELDVLYLEDTVEHRERVERARAARTGRSVVATRPLFLDLGERPILSPRPLLAAPTTSRDTPVLDLSDGRECAMTAVRGVRVAYSDRPMRVLVCRREDEVFVSLAPPKIPTLEWDEVAPPGTPGHWVLVEPPDLRGLPITPGVELRVPAETRRVTILDHIYLDPTRIYARMVPLGPDGPGDPGRPFLWHAN